MAKPKQSQLGSIRDLDTAGYGSVDFNTSDIINASDGYFSNLYVNNEPIGGVSESIITATLTESVDDWNPTGFDDCTVLRIDTDGYDYNITGFAVADVIRKTVINVSSNIVVLLNENTSSGAENRIISVQGGLALLRNDVADILYDSISQRWRLV